MKSKKIWQMYLELLLFILKIIFIFLYNKLMICYKFYFYLIIKFQLKNKIKLNEHILDVKISKKKKKSLISRSNTFEGDSPRQRDARQSVESLTRNGWVLTTGQKPPYRNKSRLPRKVQFRRPENYLAYLLPHV